DEDVLEKFNIASEIITAIRNLRKEKNIPMKEQLELYIKANKTDAYTSMDSVIAKLCNLSEINYVEDKVENAFSFLIKANEYFVPISSNIDIESEIKKLNQELDYTHGFLNSVLKKLENEKFVANAKPEIIETERKKASDAEAKIKAIEELLSSYKN
ncbi:MAG: valine--tRNA ligase, partial [Bacteroidota bacterium]|nr:valine--tRNA ligase [Bacteroidota bacterium]